MPHWSGVDEFGEDTSRWHIMLREFLKDLDFAGEFGSFSRRAK
jgi:hypothetical protein